MTYDLIVVGTGFASSFFLHRLLERVQNPLFKVLVLEAGPVLPFSEQLARRDNGMRRAAEQFINHNPQKAWQFGTTFGGGSNAWWACTPRMLPEDFRMRSLYGVASDWPLDYDDLEQYYADAEDLLQVSGPQESPFPRSRPYPQPPHRLSDVDLALQRSFPGEFFVMPTARPRRSLPNGRPACCGAGVCDLCPIDSKFTVLNSMGALYTDPRIELVTSARAQFLDVTSDHASSVVFVKDGRERRAAGQLVALGANALFNGHIMLRSGMESPQLGLGLGEQVGVSVTVELDGLDNFQGSTSLTGHGYMSYPGEHRRRKAAALIETRNSPPLLRNVRGKWRQRLGMRFIFEDLRQERNRVEVGSREAAKPEARYEGFSEYTRQGIDELPQEIERVTRALPVESYRIHEVSKSEGHILGTTVMGRDPATSVVDPDLIHHRVRNLVVLGSGAFPTIAPANPTLTICALSLRAADSLAANA
jgi:choline dehydrogenase-like flavoprotein